MKLIDSYDEQFRALDAREETLRSVIQDELSEIERERFDLLKERDEAIEDYLDSADSEALLDPTLAGELYEVGYDRGRGAPGFYRLYSSLVENTYVMSFSGWWTLRNEQSPVKMPTFALQDFYEPELFATSVALLEKLYVAASAVNPSVPIDVHGNGANYRIKFAKGHWNVHRVNMDIVIPGIATLAEALELIQVRTS